MRLVLVLAWLIALPAGAAPILDREAAWNGGTYWHDNDTHSRQTFTVGQTGLLTDIALYITANVGIRDCENYGCRLYILDPADPVISMVASGQFWYEPDPGWLKVTLSSPLPVVEGQTLALSVLHFGLLGLGRSSYDAGSLVHECNMDGCVDPRAESPFGPDFPGRVPLPLPEDYAFRTWVEPMPEPSVMVLLAISLAARRLYAQSTPAS